MISHTRYAWMTMRPKTKQKNRGQQQNLFLENKP